MAELDKVFRDVSIAHLEEFVPGNPCPDQYVADLGEYPLSFSRRPADEAPKELSPVVLILESPHFEEYRDRDHPVPAAGETGEGIRDYLQMALELLRGANLRRRPLILANAIRYQCSLGGCSTSGIATRFHRDSVFVRMWNLPPHTARANFRARLRQYVGAHQPLSQVHPNGYVVINACTSGDKHSKLQRQLRMMVEDAVRDELGHGSHIRVEHPCSWARSAAKLGRLRPWRYVAAT